MENKIVKDKVWTIISKDDFKKGSTMHPLWWENLMWYDLIAFGYEVKHVDGDIYTTCPIEELEKLESKMNFEEGYRNLVKLCLKPNYKLTTKLEYSVEKQTTIDYLIELRNQAMIQLINEGYDNIKEMGIEEQYAIDDGDRILEGIDLVLNYLTNKTKDDVKPIKIMSLKEFWNNFRGLEDDDTISMQNGKEYDIRDTKHIKIIMEE